MTDATRVRMGWALSGAVVIALVADGLMGLFAPQLLAGSLRETGFAPSAVTPISLAALVPAVLYAVPRTAVLGAILMTGFLGGAICTHLRIGDIGSPPQLICLALGVVAWSGLLLRDARVRALLPLRGGAQAAALSMPSSPSLR